ncbi:MAG: hypothetical protein ACRYG4_12285 [Janthinobacterium lividum]
MGQAMTPVKTDLSDDQRREKTNDQRQTCRECLHARWQDAVESPRDDRHRHSQNNTGNKTAEEVIGQVGNDAAPHDLRRPQGKQALEGYEYGDQQHQPGAKPENVDGERGECVLHAGHLS